MMNLYEPPPMPTDEQIKEGMVIMRGRMIFDKYFRPNKISAEVLVGAVMKAPPIDYDDFEEFKKAAFSHIRALLPEDCKIKEEEVQSMMAFVIIPAVKEMRQMRAKRIINETRN